MDYNILAVDYARHRKIHPGVLRQLIEHGDVTANTRVLEVGCGTGNYLNALHEATGCVAFGVDLSEAMLEIARAAAPDLTWKRGFAEALPFDDTVFDLVFSVDVIHHIGDRRAYFSEAQRVLAQSGQVCTATASEEDILRRRPLSSHFPETIPAELSRYPQIERLKREMLDAGLSRIDVEHVELTYDLTGSQAYRDRAFSSLHLIPPDAFKRGLSRLDAELSRGPVSALSLYTLLWASL